MRGLLPIQSCFAVMAAVLLVQVWAGDGLGSLYPLAVVYTLHLLWAGFSWRVKTGRWVDGYTLFLLSLHLFSGGQLLLYAVGLLPDGILASDSFSIATLERTCSLVLCAVCWFHLGALIGARRMKSEGRFNVVLYRKIGIALAALGGIGAIAQLARLVPLVINGGYLALAQVRTEAGAGNWDGFLAGLFVPGLLIVLATTPRAARYVWAAAIVYTVANIFVGLRGQAMLALLPLLLVHHAVVKPIGRKTVAALGIGLLLLLPIVAQLRLLSLADRIEIGRDVETEEILTAGVKEMGGSMMTVAYAVDLAGRPGLRDYEWGAGYLRAATAVIPNLFWDVHPSMAKGSYDSWVTGEAHPEWVLRGGGMGFSMVAEAFVNLAWYGAPFFFLVVGCAMAWVVSWARGRQDRVFIAVEAVLLSVGLFWPRGEAYMVVRTAAWCGIVPVLLARSRS